MDIWWLVDISDILRKVEFNRPGCWFVLDFASILSYNLILLLFGYWVSKYILTMKISIGDNILYWTCKCGNCFHHCRMSRNLIYYVFAYIWAWDKDVIYPGDHHRNLNDKTEKSSHCISLKAFDWKCLFPECSTLENKILTAILKLVQIHEMCLKIQNADCARSRLFCQRRRVFSADSNCQKITELKDKNCVHKLAQMDSR